MLKENKQKTICFDSFMTFSIKQISDARAYPTMDVTIYDFF